MSVFVGKASNEWHTCIIEYEVQDKILFRHFYVMFSKESGTCGLTLHSYKPCVSMQQYQV